MSLFFVGFRVYGYCPRMMGNHMEENIENDMEAGIMLFKGVILCILEPKTKDRWSCKLPCKLCRADGTTPGRRGKELPGGRRVPGCVRRDRKVAGPGTGCMEMVHVLIVIYPNPYSIYLRGTVGIPVA